MDEATHKKNFKPINIRDLFMNKNPSLEGVQKVKDHVYFIAENQEEEFSYIQN